MEADLYQLGDLADSFKADHSCFAVGLERSEVAVNELVATMHKTVARELCPQCNRPFGVSCTRVDSPMRVRYLACRKCKTRGRQPELVPLDVAPPQSGPGRPPTVMTGAG